MYFDFDGCKHLFWWLEYSIYVCINVYHKTFYCKCFWNTHTNYTQIHISWKKPPLEPTIQKKPAASNKTPHDPTAMLAHELDRLTAQARAQQFHQVPIPVGRKKTSFFWTPQKSRLIGWFDWLYIYIFWFIFFISDVIVLQGGPTEPDKSYKWS